MYFLQMLTMVSRYLKVALPITWRILLSQYVNGIIENDTNNIVLVTYEDRRG